MNVVELDIEGMTCVTYDPKKAGLAELKRALERAGYEGP